MNQYFQKVCDPTNPKSYIATPGYSTPVPGWWWIGAQKTTAGTLYTPVYIYNYGPYHNFLGVTKCYPPESQASNWYPCPGL